MRSFLLAEEDFFVVHLALRTRTIGVVMVAFFLPRSSFCAGERKRPIVADPLLRRLGKLCVLRARIVKPVHSSNSSAAISHELSSRRRCDSSHRRHLA